MISALRPADPLPRVQRVTLPWRDQPGAIEATHPELGPYGQTVWRPRRLTLRVNPERTA
jgi:hypothetical protein